MISKRAKGQFYTEGNPFRHRAFRKWAKDAGLPETRVLEPFAGSNSLIWHLQGMDLCNSFKSYDIEPAARFVSKRNTLASFPKGFDVCVTNPPWLARNSATVRGIAFPDCPYDDLYKFALSKCLAECGHVAALVPESFIRAGEFQERLISFVSLTTNLFSDTGHPTGLALFGPDKCPDVQVWSGKDNLGFLSDLEMHRPQPRPDGPQVRFNDPDGNAGLIALDNTREASIRFCDAAELDGYKVKTTGRHITKMRVEGPIDIAGWNKMLEEFRKKTRDVLLTCYKGIRKDGQYRRRLDWNLARGIIHHAQAS